MRILSLSLSLSLHASLPETVGIPETFSCHLVYCRKRLYTSSEVVRLLNNTDSDLESDSEPDSLLDSSFHCLN